MNKNCVISAVGHNSLHRMWIKGRCNFDLHLIVYDDSLEEYRDDAEHICHIKGYKLRNIYKYLESNPQIIKQYDYFFFPDDDIRMESETINALFEAMYRYKLQIAQPALRMSYYSWPHTLRDPFCRLRYTNMIEMMVPCFSRDALQKVLFTFNENETGWGTEAHWPLLIDSTHRDMAVIDEICIVHTRPIQSGQSFHFEERATYLNKYGLSTATYEYGYIPADNRDKYLCDRNVFRRHKETLAHWAGNRNLSFSSIGEDGCFGYVHLLFLLAGITDSQQYADMGLKLLEHVQDGLGTIKDDMRFGSGIAGCSWLIEFLAQEGFIDNNPEEVLEEVSRHIEQYLDRHGKNMSLMELSGVGRYYLARFQGRKTRQNMADCKKVRKLLQGRLEHGNTFPDMSTASDALSLLQECGREVSEQLKTLERQAWSVPCTPIEHAYISFRLYRLTGDDHFRIKVYEELKNLPPRLLTLKSALMLAEILFYTIK